VTRLRNTRTAITRSALRNEINVSVCVTAAAEKQKIKVIVRRPAAACGANGETFCFRGRRKNWQLQIIFFVSRRANFPLNYSRAALPGAARAESPSGPLAAKIKRYSAGSLSQLELIFIKISLAVLRWDFVLSWDFMRLLNCELHKFQRNS
jgi:hypothetical protein